ncbi:TIGR04222 domain-containing membrane protein [Actinoplanes sp. NPDC049265]|uniref:TIGR04222 domain-containing membrane protein n=1 Tax=Actinoplanes sp. NPDC049265 TaxID=3363902 RepID=UPI00371C4918
MQYYAAPTDTWGIPGPTFVGYYVVAVIAAALIAWVARRILFAGPSGDTRLTLAPQQVAYLNGRDNLAVYASLTGLRAAGVLTSGAGGFLQVAGSMPAGLTPLDVAVYNAAGRGVRTRDLNQDQHVRSALDQLRESVERTGYATTASQRSMARLWACLPVAVVLLGVARMIAGVQNGKAVGNLTLLLVVAVIAAILALVRANRGATYATGKALRQLRKDNQHLAPRMSPSLTTYGASTAAMGVGLFGAASLYAMDPAFAADAEIRRNIGTDASGGGSSCSSGSSCSGGSSCGGGGGGCGGGGCGG